MFAVNWGSVFVLFTLMAFIYSLFRLVNSLRTARRHKFEDALDDAYHWGVAHGASINSIPSIPCVELDPVDHENIDAAMESMENEGGLARI